MAGFAGTLSPGKSVFGDIGGCGPRAWSGPRPATCPPWPPWPAWSHDHDGRVLVFAFDAAQRAAADLQTAADSLNDAAGALASCGCH